MHVYTLNKQFFLFQEFCFSDIMYVLTFYSCLIAVASDDRSILRDAIVPILSNEQCSLFYSGIATIHNFQFCAG